MIYIRSARRELVRVEAKLDAIAVQLEQLRRRKCVCSRPPNAAVIAWLNACCDRVDHSVRTSASLLYAHYVTWSLLNGDAPALSQSSFGRSLSSLGFGVAKDKTGRRRRIGIMVREPRNSCNDGDLTETCPKVSVIKRQNGDAS